MCLASSADILTNSNFSNKLFLLSKQKCLKVGSLGWDQKLNEVVQELGSFKFVLHRPLQLLAFI